jgi:Transcription factor WhiB
MGSLSSSRSNCRIGGLFLAASPGIAGGSAAAEKAAFLFGSSSSSEILFGPTDQRVCALHDRTNLRSMASSFVEQLLARTWTEEAACRDYADLDAFFIEPGSGEQEIRLSSVRVLNAMLLCVSCTVRRECLTEALTPHPLAGRATGIWEASTYAERHALRHLPPDQAVDVLEAGLVERVRRRVEAVAAKHPTASRSCSLE